MSIISKEEAKKILDQNPVDDALKKKRSAEEYFKNL